MSASPQGEVDPLVSNGLGSPLCRGALGAQQLSATARRNCETSGFVAAGAPTASFGIDVHIDTGLLGLSPALLLVAVQDLFVTPLWMALVWAVHALVVMLEWCFALDLLAEASAGLGSGLRGMLSAFTEPLLAAALSVAAVFAAYNGLVRRRVAETLGQSLMTGAMMVGGLWLALDPGGTVGTLGAWANQASLGTLAVSASGSPAAAERTLGDSMAGVFSAAVEVPWCYMEFGDVGWCRNPARLDPGLRRAALRIAASQLALVGCSHSSGLSACVPSGSRSAKALEHSAQLLRSARSNGAIFLALPANGRERNSINDEESLLRVMCQSSEATHCRGPMAAQAEFRTEGGTWKRVGGLLLIVAGVLGMLLLLGFIALRLLGAAIFSLLYLLLAPAAVLAPAFGESGRKIFRRWISQLLGAVAAKLLFALLLGVVLAVLAVLAALEALGWWTQWLLMSAFWWGAYGRRHQVLGLAGASPAVARETRPRSVVRRAREAFRASRGALAVAGLARRRLTGPGRYPERIAVSTRARRERAPVRAGEKLPHSVEVDRREAARRMGALAEARSRLSAKRAQLTRVQREQRAATVRGDRRRALKLSHRERRLQTEIADEQQWLAAAQRAAGSRSRSAPAEDRVRAEQLRRGFDAQVRLPPRPGAAAEAVRDRRERQAPTGHGPAEYSRLVSGGGREAGLRTDRGSGRRGEPENAAEELAPDAMQRAERRRGRDGVRESRVMRDARELAARRKRQLGRDRP